ncbi:MAG: TonB-dependent receptor [Pseudomonadota bacterium]
MNNSHNYFGPKSVLTSISVAVLALMNQAAAQQSASDPVLQKVEVTGSSIRHLASENALPVTTIKAEELINRGLTTMSEVATSLAVGATNEPVGGGGGGTQINLRGLNTNRTLVLLDGRRLANEAAGDSSSNVDVIPLSAIDRVEILRDGASSIYGTDAIAGVVNFITKRAVSDSTFVATAVRPERTGGGSQQGFSLIAGKGDLVKDGWNLFAAFDTRKRSSLLQKDRPNITDPDALVALGGTAFSSNNVGSSSSPANYTLYKSGKPVSPAVTGNPYFSAGCVAPYGQTFSIPSTKANNTTCILDPTLYPQLLPANKQTTLFSKGTLAHGDNKKLTVELSLAQEYIEAENPPQVFGTQTDYNKTSPGLRLPLIMTSASKWYPGKSGGVPAVAGVTTQDLSLLWSMDELGPATTHDQQNNNRLVVTDEGEFLGWDYRAGLLSAYSKRATQYKSGFVTTPGIYSGVLNGVLNPFGPQDAAGKTYLDSLSVDGQYNTISTVSYYGGDVNFGRELMPLAGGPLAISIGADAHRETFTQDTPMVNDLVVYKTSALPDTHPRGARSVYAAYMELDAPLSKAWTMNLAARADRFSDFGGTVNPKLSTRYQPMKSLMFRGAYSTGFRAPTLPELYGTPQTKTASTSKWDDPLLCPSATPSISGTGKLTTDPKYAGLNLDATKVCGTQLTVLSGANPNLSPEKSKTLTAGVVIEPIKNLTASVDFWSIKMKGTIAQVTETLIFTDPVKYASLFVRNADGTLNYINVQKLNMGGLRTNGEDVNVTYTLPTADYGRFVASIDGTYVNRYSGQNEVGGAWGDNVGQPGALSTGSTSANTYVYRWRHNLSLRWTSKDWGVGLTQFYTSHYVDTNALATQQAGQPYYNVIDSYTLYNLSVNYSGFKNLKLAGGINNLLDTDPPLSNQRLSSKVVFAQNVSKPIGRAFTVRATYSF